MHGCRVITICHSIASFVSFSQVTITICSDVHKRRKVEKPRRRVSSGQPDVTSTSIAGPMAWQVLRGFRRSIGHALLHGHAGVVSLAAASRFLMLSKGCCCRMDVSLVLVAGGLMRSHWSMSLGRATDATVSWLCPTLYSTKQAATFVKT